MGPTDRMELMAPMEPTARMALMVTMDWTLRVAAVLRVVPHQVVEAADKKTPRIDYLGPKRNLLVDELLTE